MKKLQTNIKIRQAIETDYPRILELFKEFATFEKHPEMVTNSVVLMMQEREYFNCFVAETDETLIADKIILKEQLQKAM